jgi:hypothetical protein
VSWQVNLRLAPGADLSQGKRKMEALRGVERVRQVFPDHADQELARMFVLDVAPTLGEETLASLRQAKFVEEVELAPKRRIKPPR